MTIHTIQKESPPTKRWTFLCIYCSSIRISPCSASYACIYSSSMLFSSWLRLRLCSFAIVSNFGSVSGFVILNPVTLILFVPIFFISLVVNCLTTPHTCVIFWLTGSYLFAGVGCMQLLVWCLHFSIHPGKCK